MPKFITGQPVPNVRLGFIQDDQVRFVSAPSLFAGRRAIVIGVPGAFTPVCTHQHVPDFVRNADRLRASGYDLLVCIAPNDPFVLRMWSGNLDPDGKLRFLSDGNLDWTTALGLGSTERDLCLGQRSQRYMLNIEDGILGRLRVEAGILDFSCTRMEAVTELE